MSGTIPFYDERLIGEIRFAGCECLHGFMELLAASLGVNSEEFRRQYLGEFKPEPYAYISAGYGRSRRVGKEALNMGAVIDPAYGDGLIVGIAGDSMIIIDEVDAALVEAWQGFSGCIVIDEIPQHKSKAEIIALIASLESKPVALEDMPRPVECKLDFDAYDWKRQRDYPTLKQGLRDPHFRKRHRR